MDVNAITPFVRSVFQFKRWQYSNRFCTLAYDHRVFYIADANAQVYIDGKDFFLPCDTILYVPCGTEYNIQNDDTAAPITLYGANFDFFPFHSYRRDVIPVTRGGFFSPEKCLEVVDDPLFGRPFFIEKQVGKQLLFARMLTQYRERPRFYEGMLSALLKEILTDLAQKRTGAEKGVIYELVSAYIASHYAEELTNQSIAAELHYHPYYLSERMRRETGLTLHEYLLQYRIRMAVLLLENTCLSMEEIAGQTGFRTASHFTVCFKRFTGTLPSKYREDYEKEP